MELDLSSQETEVLSEALQIYLSELRAEIGNTDKKDFRDQLKQKKAVLRGIHDRLTAG